MPSFAWCVHACDTHVTHMREPNMVLWRSNRVLCTLLILPHHHVWCWDMTKGDAQRALHCCNMSECMHVHGQCMCVHSPKGCVHTHAWTMCMHVCEGQIWCCGGQIWCCEVLWTSHAPICTFHLHHVGLSGYGYPHASCLCIMHAPSLLGVHVQGMCKVDAQTGEAKYGAVRTSGPYLHHVG